MVIGSRAVVGKRCQLRDGCHVLPDAVVAPETLVPPFTVFGGNPATMVCRLHDNITADFKAFTVCDRGTAGVMAGDGRNKGTSMNRGNAMHAVRTQCEVLDVGKYSNPSFGPFSQASVEAVRFALQSTLPDR